MLRHTTRFDACTPWAAQERQTVNTLVFFKLSPYVTFGGYQPFRSSRLPAVCGCVRAVIVLCFCVRRLPSRMIYYAFTDGVSFQHLSCTAVPRASADLAMSRVLPASNSAAPCVSPRVHSSRLQLLSFSILSSSRVCLPACLSAFLSICLSACPIFFLHTVAAICESRAAFTRKLVLSIEPNPAPSSAIASPPSSYF